MARRNIIVTGGAGYIGSHICKALVQTGFQPVALDNLSHGFARLVKWGPLEVGELSDGAWLADTFARYEPQAVIHCAGLISVAESSLYPERYFHHNVHASEVLLGAMQQANIRPVIFSSSAAVYGNCAQMPIAETETCTPQSPYAKSKWQIEQAIAAGDFPSMSLRYFNAAGADEGGETGELHDPETHLIPLAIKAALTGESFSLYGTDYATPDGTAIRDYIHVSDVAEAHVLALKHLLAKGGKHTLNLGTGRGHSVREVIAKVEALAGQKLRLRHAPRRPGDVPSLVASGSKAQALLGFTPCHSSLENILQTALHWHRQQL